VKTLRIYVDTSVIGGCFDTKYQLWSNALMRDFDLGLLKPVVSDLSGFEIAGAPPHVQGVYARLATVAEQVATTAEVEDLLAHYETKAIIGPRYRNDMQYIALATVYGVDVLVSWNFKHMLRFDKVRLFNAANLEMGYGELRIHSPREVTTYDPEADD
jgi:hypothetical protein